jgi:hypothetical protein
VKEILVWEKVPGFSLQKHSVGIVDDHQIHHLSETSLRFPFGILSPLTSRSQLLFPAIVTMDRNTCGNQNCRNHFQVHSMSREPNPASRADSKSKGCRDERLAIFMPNVNSIIAKTLHRAVVPKNSFYAARDDGFLPGLVGHFWHHLIPNNVLGSAS